MPDKAIFVRSEAEKILRLCRTDQFTSSHSSSTVKALAEIGVRVYCLALGGADVASSAGTMTMNVLNAVAQFERDLLMERTHSGLKRAKSECKIGRPFTLSEKQKLEVRQELATGLSVSAVARKFATSRQTIMRVRDEGTRFVRP